MRRTASSTRASGIVPFSASFSVLSNSSFQRCGAIAISSPALKTTGQSPPLQPGTWLCAFQSPMMKPSKPSRPFKTSVSRLLLPCILTPFQEEKLAITVMAPALTAAT
jgi:hypothetical protein